MPNTEQGLCPKCSSENLEYGSTRIEESSLGYDFTCNDCGCTGVEWYDLTYSETICEK